MRRSTLLTLATAAVTGGAALEIERRRLLRLRDRDPDWHELSRPLEGRVLTARSKDGTQLHVEVFGDDAAPTIVLIHGWLEAIRLWHHQIRDLSRDFRVVAYDQRGHGLSEAPHGEAYTDEALADDLQAVLDACVPDGSQCIVVGHSMGGMTIVAWAGRHPDVVQRRLAGAALISTGMSDLMRVGFLGVVMPDAAREAVMRATLLSQLAWPTRLDAVAYYLTRRVAFTRGSGAGAIAFAHEMFTSTQAVVRAGFGRTFVTLDLTPGVRHLTVPTLLVAGELDLLLPLEHSERLAATLPNLVEYAKLPGVGHMAPLEAPQEVTPRIGRLARACLIGTQPAPRSIAASA
jgi:pimeloyl-ACP methyl ester carboxylesterase